MKQPKTSTFVSFCLHIAGFLLCILPPAICTLNYFPLWREVGYESCIAGGGALILALCAIPIYKLIMERLKSFSSYIMWLVLFLLFFGMSRIADQMTVICFVGFVSNVLGAICFFVAKKIHRRA
jgi:hypothetical protein